MNMKPWKIEKTKYVFFAIKIRLQKIIGRLPNIFKSRIYFDYAAVTPTDPAVLKTYVSASRKYIANPSSLHADGVMAKNALEKARLDISNSIFAHSDEIIFCGSGTEANNIAILSTVMGIKKARNCNYSDLQVMVSAIEHVSVLGPVRILEEMGVSVIKIPVLENGQIDVEFLEKNISSKTVLVSVMAINNEIGSMQPVLSIAKIIRKVRKAREEEYTNSATGGFNQKNQDEFLPIYLHTDASQAFLYEEIDTRKMGVDLITLDSHKVYGPRGAGLLWVRRTLLPVLQKAPVVAGGHQEGGIRAGTEAVPTIVAFAHALCLAQKRRTKDVKYVSHLRDIFISTLTKTLPKGSFHINCADRAVCAPHIISISFPVRDHEELLFRLDAVGISASTKSSCQSDEDESYVLKQIGITGGAIRFSFGRQNTKREIVKVVKVLAKILKDL